MEDTVPHLQGPVKHLDCVLGLCEVTDLPCDTRPCTTVKSLCTERRCYHWMNARWRWNVCDTWTCFHEDTSTGACFTGRARSQEHPPIRVTLTYKLKGLYGFLKGHNETTEIQCSRMAAVRIKGRVRNQWYATQIHFYTIIHWSCTTFTQNLIAQYVF